LSNCDDEWSTHKKIIRFGPDTKPLASAIPSRFPYLALEYDVGVGIAHVVENPKLISSDFCLDVVRGLLQSAEDEIENGDNGEERGRDSQPPSVEDFRRAFKRYDWRQYDLSAMSTDCT